MDIEHTKAISIGHWQSIAPEVRPSGGKNSHGTPQSFYLSRSFALSAANKFELIVTKFADPYGKVPLARIDIKGTIEWLEGHPIADGAVKVNFSADEDHALTPLSADFAAVLNQSTKGFSPWKAGETQSIFGKDFLPFGLLQGEIFKEYDLIYVLGNFMFWGARNVDGRGFDTEQNRPTNLQIALVRIIN